MPTKAGRFELMTDLSKFWASGPDRFTNELFSNGKTPTPRCLDIAGVANLILTASNTTTLLIIHTGEH